MLMLIYSNEDVARSLAILSLLYIAVKLAESPLRILYNIVRGKVL